MHLLQRFWEAIVRFWKRRHLTQILLLILLVFILLSILWFAFIASRANVQTLKDGLSQATTIYDRNGDEASKLATNRTGGVSIKDMPEHVPNAVIAIEDERFYEHNGFDIKGIARAFFGNLLAGGITGGGSTLTQQLTKNALLSSERTYKRKVEELFLAVELEKEYEKDEIIEMYLNQVYFGSGAFGINNASKKYFAKNIQDVTISEAALLAGLLKAPSALDPYNNYDAAIKRRNVVLAKMNELGMISDSEFKKAKDEKIVLEDGGGSLADRKYPSYVDAVLDEATSKYGLTQDEIMTRGYRIYTELDQDIQAGLENVFKQDRLFPDRSRDVLVQSGSVLLNPDNGGVRALVGGRGEKVFRGFNRATHLRAQPGSTMKPLAVYTPALEEGYEYDSMLVDEKMSFKNYSPKNFSDTYQGEVPMYEAVEKSINIPAVWLLNEIGLNKGIDAVKRFGIKVEKEDQNLALALGGMHNGVSPLQMAEAYSVFPNGGKKHDAHLITKIVGPTGKMIAEHDGSTTRVTSKSVANEMTSMLLNVVETGTGKGTNIEGVEIAGKTGSTQLPYSDINGTKDQWFVGYTPNIVGAVWLGYDKTDRDHYLSSSSSRDVVPLFRAIMEETVPHIEQEDFKVQSINERKSGAVVDYEETEKAIREKANELEQELKERAGKVEEKLKEEAPKWKRVFDQMQEDAGKVGDKVMDKLKEWQGQ
ncbi:transglycosylase domain-containing protein [Mesobacillus selenatarsenatis]|uniref:PBP1A family penicillin-binding protein n=1 Tax=Mesobacillus selenatarsenatis TaxID=388741 RepID=A0A846TWS4_9BACI|nr:PBP1A family penicillin-binding protein [Mesobacillus selenatarsenatis]NKE06146.1 PBP1A family penicillin-binding protein [Mesobacillus selenatarsenatis]